MFKPTVTRAWLGAFAFIFVVSGCTCRNTGTTVKPGKISILFDEVGVNKTARDGIYDFGQVPMGKKVTLQLKVTNTGSGSLRLESLERDGTGDPVSITGMSDPGVPVFLVDFKSTELGSGESAEFAIVFDSPTDPDLTKVLVPHGRKLILRASNTEAGEEAASIELKGTSVSGECELPTTLDFGSVSRGDTFALSILFKNTRPIDGTASIGDIMSNSGDHDAFAFSPESPKGDVTLKPAQEKTVTVSFAPTELKDYLARVTMRRLDGCPDKVVKLIGTGVDKVLTWGPDPLEFGYVTPGLLVTRELTFTNLGLKDVSVLTLQPATAEYKAVTVAPVTVPPAVRDANGVLQPGSIKVTLSFKPTLLGPRNTRLDFTTNLIKQAGGFVLLKGYGGGPDIDVKPPSLNFGRVAYFQGANPASYVNRKLTIQNVGTRPTPPDAKANLHLGMGGTGTTYWTVAVKAGVTDNTATLGELCLGELVAGTCTNAPSAAAYDPLVGIEASGTKALLDVPIRVTPVVKGIKAWEVTLFSDDPDEASFTVTILAEALELPPCDYEVTPLTLNFGLVTPPDYKDLSFTIKNRSQTAGDLCLVSSLDLKPGSDVIFSLPAGPQVDKEIQPGASLTVAVRAWPQGTVPTALTNISGVVNFSISNPMKPEGTVSLNAAIAASCLTIAPDDLNFGTVQKDCSSQTRTFSVYNTCNTAVTVTSYSMVAPAGAKANTPPDCPGTSDCPEFIAVSTAGIAPNTSIPPSAAPVTFSLKYHPINYGPDNGAFLLKVVQNGTTVDYLVTLSGNGDTMGLNNDVFKQDSKPKADILLVIDNSCSMSDKQIALSTNFASFIKYAVSAQVDYQIGVTTTDMPSEGGRILGDATNPKVLKPTTPDVENKFKSKVNVGINGSGSEEILAPAVAALTAPIITSDNAGLLRADAVLAVVAVTDAADQSPLPVSHYANLLINVKGAQHASQFSFNAVAPFLSSAPGACSYDEPSAGGDPRILTMVQQTSGVKEEICTPDWAKSLEQIGKNAFGYRTNFFLISTPDLTAGKVIVVKIDGVQLDPIDSRGAQVWTYDSTGNSVNFEPLFVPEPGKTLTITYFVACIP